MITGNLRGICLVLIMCHLVGDYVLQNDFIAKTKGDNDYHLFVHCLLYCLPFMLFMSGWRIVLLLVSHVIIDSLKAKFNKITYAQDQLYLYLVLFILAITLI